MPSAGGSMPWRAVATFRAPRRAAARGLLWPERCCLRRFSSCDTEQNLPLYLDLEVRSKTSFGSQTSRRGYAGQCGSIRRLRECAVQRSRSASPCNSVIL